MGFARRRHLHNPLIPGRESFLARIDTVLRHSLLGVCKVLVECGFLSQGTLHLPALTACILQHRLVNHESPVEIFGSCHFNLALRVVSCPLRKQLEPLRKLLEIDIIFHLKLFIFVKYRKGL